MKLYFSILHVPELAGLTREQRKAVFQCALEAFFHERPSRVWFGVPWLLGGLLGGALAGGMVATRCGLSRARLLVIGVGGLVGLMLGIFIAVQFMAAQLRPYYRRVLEGRKDELGQIN